MLRHTEESMLKAKNLGSTNKDLKLDDKYILK